MNLIRPMSPPYDPLTWNGLPFAEKARLVCQAWAIQGYGSPLAVYIVYALKILFYIYGWIFFCSFSPGMEWTDFLRWWSSPVAFQKAILWSLLFEVLGLGCGSGPLTGRYFPPLGGILYFARPGTTKLALFPGTPVIGTNRRTIFDAALYLALILLALYVLTRPAPRAEHFVYIVLTLALLGVLDKTIFLAARAEHYWVTLVCFAWAERWLPGAMGVQLALWFFAGFSKLNHHFPYVVCVMASNSPSTPFAWFRKKMYRAYPDDLTPSDMARVKARMGTLLELAVPIVFLAGVLTGLEAVLMVGLVMMVLLHAYITSNVPMGVPLEWNVMVVYAGFFFFLGHRDVSPFDLDDAILGACVIFCSLFVPLLGNLKPRWVSFLQAMRYYAGNWACSVWFFRGDSYRKLDRLTKSAPWVFDQLDRFYDRSTAVGLVGKVIAFRLMHLHGRAFQKLIPRALAGKFEEYEWVEGELVAGLALGWNFGEGHLHNEQLLTNLQQQCGFEPGELRCIMIESQALGSDRLPYRIRDAASGLIEAGDLSVRELRTINPW